MRAILRTGIIIFLCALFFKGEAQTDQTVGNGAQTTPVNFPAGGCTYQWTNSNPAIGLPASGTGNIAAFTAVNNGNGSISGTITATPVPTGFAYITNEADNTVSVISTVTQKIITTIPVQNAPFTVAISPDGTRVYINNTGSGGTSSISVIDATTNQVTQTVLTDRGEPIYGMVVSADGSKLYTVDSYFGTLVVYDTKTFQPLAQFQPFGNFPLFQMALSRDGNTLYMANFFNNSVTLVNTLTNTSIADIQIGAGSGPWGLAMSPDGSRLYVTNQTSNDVSVINTATQTVVATIPVGNSPYGISVSPDGSHTYVANFWSNSVSIIDNSTDAVTATLNVGQNPVGVSLSPDGSTLYVVNKDANNVSLINTVTNQLISNIPVGSYPSSPNNFISAGPGCNSTPITFKIIVNSGPTPVVTTSTVTGSISSCVGSPSESPDIAQFTVAGTGLSGDITVTAPAGFDVSLTATGGYSPSLTLKDIGGAVISTTIYVRSSASDPVGPISGNIQITTPGATADQVAVTGTVNALPTVVPLPDVTYNSGDTTVPISFTGTANSFTWINSTPSIGLPASGTGDIPAFTAKNTGTAPIRASVVVTPVNSSISGCAGTSITFIITVNSLTPSITPGPISGTITSCAGTPSVSPNIGQFTVSGNSLTGDITATAPEGFEVSLTPDGGYANDVVIPQSAGTVDNVTIYVRLSASDGGSISGTAISGQVTLVSPGVQNQSVTVTGTVYSAPTVTPVTSQTVTVGQPTTPVNFTGTAGSYSWTNDTPGIGLPASGTGNISSFTAIDPNGNIPVKATITVLPQSTSATACNGAPVTFTITVSPAPPVITSSGTLAGLSTIYGTASSSESFTVSATNALTGILVTPPRGFEVSTDNSTFSPTVTTSSAEPTINATVYVRLAATTPVGNYTGNIMLSTKGAPDLNVNMPLSVVKKALLTITAPNVTRVYGVPNPIFVPTYQGFVNGDDPSTLDVLPDLTTTATITSQPGQYTISVSGGSSHNYTIIRVDGTLTIVPSLSEISIPNAFTPNGDGINDLWNIKNLVDFPQCIVSVYSRYGSLVFQSRGYVKPWDGTSNGSPVPTGTYYYVINPNLSGLPPLSGYVAVLR